MGNEKRGQDGESVLPENTGLDSESFADLADNPDDIDFLDLKIQEKKSDSDHMNDDRVNFTAKGTGAVGEEDMDLKNEISDVIFQRIKGVEGRQTNADT